MLITGSDGTYYWVTLNKHEVVKIISLSDSDARLIKQFGQSWVNFLGAAWYG